MKSIMGKTLVMLAVILLLTHVFNERIIQIAFNLNRDYIQSELCINKDNPESNCFGKCYFSNQIKKNQERKQSPEYQSNKQTYYLTVLENTECTDYSEDNTHTFEYSFMYSSSFTSTLFRPPITA